MVLCGDNSKFGALWCEEVKKDLRARNEIKVLSKKLDDISFLKHWDVYVAKNPISANRDKRYQGFVEYLKYNVNTTENNQNLEILINWAENKKQVT